MQHAGVELNNPASATPWTKLGGTGLRATPSPLESSLAVVRQWLDKITAASTNPDLDLRNLRAVLIQPLKIVSRSGHKRPRCSQGR